MLERPDYGTPANILLPDKSVKTIIIEREGKTHTKYGIIHHDKLVELEWGGKVKTSTGATARIFKPTLQDIEMNLFRRKSQVIYPKDSMIMIMLSGIKEGSKVGEAGVGSGFLTAYILEKIGDKGTYRGYDIRSDMIKIATDNLKIVYPDREINITKKDIRKGIVDSNYDAFFLDMPDPWNAMEPLHKSLKNCGRIIVFVPTINQVIKVTRSVQDNKKYHVNSIIECLIREYQRDPEAIRADTIQVTHTGYIISLIKQL